MSWRPAASLRNSLHRCRLPVPERSPQHPREQEAHSGRRRPMQLQLRPQSVSRSDSSSDGALVVDASDAVTRLSESYPLGKPKSKSKSKTMLGKGDFREGTTSNPRYNNEQTSSAHAVCSKPSPRVILRELNDSATSNSVVMAPLIASPSMSSLPSRVSNLAQNTWRVTSCAQRKPAPLSASSSLDHSFIGTQPEPSCSNDDWAPPPHAGARGGGPIQPSWSSSPSSSMSPDGTKPVIWRGSSTSPAAEAGIQIVSSTRPLCCLRSYCIIVSRSPTAMKKHLRSVSSL
mmetsp:Transcript_49044/g.124450  ORF Transcript_49044/g.124450 Transcript_49044/m.124450 type:complete len:288 (+) Transcript_49044:224-1087(+)